LIDVTTVKSTIITTTTVVDGDGFFGQGVDQLNGGRGGTVDLMSVLFCVVMGCIVDN
jgi:hypothetical protein